MKLPADIASYNAWTSNRSDLPHANDPDAPSGMCAFCIPPKLCCLLLPSPETLCGFFSPQTTPANTLVDAFVWADTSIPSHPLPRPTIGLVLQRSHLVSRDDAHYVAMVQELESRGAKVREAGGWWYHIYVPMLIVVLALALRIYETRLENIFLLQVEASVCVAQSVTTGSAPQNHSV